MHLSGKLIQVFSCFNLLAYSFFGFVTLILLFAKSIKGLHNFTKKKLNERKKRLQKQKENLERIKALRKRKQKQNGLYDDDNEDEDDDLELEELEKDGHHAVAGSRTLGRGRNSVSPSKEDADSKKRSSIFPSKSDLKASQMKESNDGEQNEEGSPEKIEDEQDSEQKAKKQLNLLKEVEGKRRMQLVRLMYLNFKNFGFWINAAAFIVSYTFVAYTYFNLPSSSTPTEKGVVSL